MTRPTAPDNQHFERSAPDNRSLRAAKRRSNLLVGLERSLLRTLFLLAMTPLCTAHWTGWQNGRSPDSIFPAHPVNPVNKSNLATLNGTSDDWVVSGFTNTSLDNT